LALSAIQRCTRPPFRTASGKLKCQPRAHFGTTKDGKQFGGGTGVGRYWDPSAEPVFLTKGFNDNRELVDQAFYGAMKI